jgi:hypothetical protein
MSPIAAGNVKPECARPTVGANAAQDGSITIGVGAHICAASPGGPRYNPAQTLADRRGKDNCIWLCQNCGRLVDADPQKFTVEVLIGWKRDAQERAFRELVAPGVPAPTEEAARVGSIIVAHNNHIAQLWGGSIPAPGGDHQESAPSI